MAQHIHAQPQRHSLHGIQGEIAAHACQCRSALVAEEDQAGSGEKQSGLSSGNTWSMSHLRTSGVRSARRLAAVMQRKLATCQGTKGRICFASQRNSLGIFRDR